MERMFRVRFPLQGPSHFKPQQELSNELKHPVKDTAPTFLLGTPAALERTQVTPAVGHAIGSDSHACQHDATDAPCTSMHTHIRSLVIFFVGTTERNNIISSVLSSHEKDRERDTSSSPCLYSCTVFLQVCCTVLIF